MICRDFFDASFTERNCYPVCQSSAFRKLPPHHAHLMNIELDRPHPVSPTTGCYHFRRSMHTMFMVRAVHLADRQRRPSSAASRAIPVRRRPPSTLRVSIRSVIKLTFCWSKAWPSSDRKRRSGFQPGSVRRGRRLPVLGRRLPLRDARSNFIARHSPKRRKRCCGRRRKNASPENEIFFTSIAGRRVGAADVMARIFFPARRAA